MISRMSNLVLFIITIILIDKNETTFVSKIMYAESYEGIYLLPLTAKSTKDSYKLYSIEGMVSGIEYDIRSNLLFWNNATTIFAAPLNILQDNLLSIESSKVLLQSNKDISKITYDWIHKLLYYPYCDSDNEENTGINVINIMRPKLIHKINLKNTNYIRDIAVDPIKSVIVWSFESFEKEGIIAISNQDGSDSNVLVNNLEVPVTITLDIDRATIYWIDRKEYTLREMSYSGTHRKIILISQKLFKPIFQMDIFGDNIYWSHYRTDSVLITNKYGLNETKMIVQIKSDFDNIVGIKILSNLRQKQVLDGCNKYNCLQLCLPVVPNKYKCVCDSDLDQTIKNLSEHQTSIISSSFLIILIFVPIMLIFLIFIIYFKVFKNYKLNVCTKNVEEDNNQYIDPANVVEDNNQYINLADVQGEIHDYCEIMDVSNFHHIHQKPYYLQVE